jgi:hypothetical protein
MDTQLFWLIVAVFLLGPIGYLARRANRRDLLFGLQLVAGFRRSGLA